jgi:hypothetical protein
MFHRFWLYVRLTLLGLIALWVVQMLIWNIANHNLDKRARTFCFTDEFGGAWSLVAAFVLGVFITPLWIASVKAMKEFQVDRARQREIQAERSLRQSIAQAAAATAPKPTPEPPPAKPGGADIWTSGEQGKK